jgi:hypothetical protein
LNFRSSAFLKFESSLTPRARNVCLDAWLAIESNILPFPIPLPQVKSFQVTLLIYVEQSPFVVNVSAQQQSNQITTSHGLEICSTMEGVGTNCLFCMLTDNRFHSHTPSQCRYSKGRCVVCLSPSHNTSNISRPCNVKAEKGICWGCRLPKSIGGTTIHPQPFGKSCKHPLQDRLLSLEFTIFHDDRLRPQLETKFDRSWSSDVEFSKWINAFADWNARVIYLIEVFRWALTDLAV